VPQRAPPGLICKIQWREALKSCLAALEPHTERFLKNSLGWCSANMMVLAAALGGSGAVSCLWSTIGTATRSGTRIESGKDVGPSPEATDRNRR
jgi:hypothetical protein